MHDYDVVITRACLPPHVIRFFKLDQVTDDEPCLPYKEMTIEAEPFWASVYKNFTKFSWLTKMQSFQTLLKIDNEAMSMTISSKLMLFGIREIFLRGTDTVFLSDSPKTVLYNSDYPE